MSGIVCECMALFSTIAVEEIYFLLLFHSCSCRFNI